MYARWLVAMVAGCAVGMGSAAPAAAQQFSVSSAEGLVLTLPDGRLAVLQSGANGVTVRGLVDGEPKSGDRIDIAIGDRVVRFQGLANPALERIKAAYEGLAVGGEVVVGLARGDGERVIRFPKPAPGAGRLMAVAGASGGAGAWTSSDGASGAKAVVIGGVHVRENTQGMPEVTHRESDPAAASIALRVGDVITSLNGRSIAALAGLEKLYQEVAAGASITLVVQRGGQPVEVAFRKPTS